MSTYTYTKDAALGQLIQEIEASSIVPTVGGITPLDNGTINIDFDGTLSGPEEATLDSVVSSHTYVTSPVEGLVIYVGSFGDADGIPIRADNTVYKRIRSFIFKGTDFWGKAPEEVKIGVYIDNNSETGTIRLYDTTNDVELGNVTTTSENEELVEMTTSNWPTGEATIQIQAKTTKKRVYTYCTSLTILG